MLLNVLNIDFNEIHRKLYEKFRDEHFSYYDVTLIITNKKQFFDVHRLNLVDEIIKIMIEIKAIEQKFGIDFDKNTQHLGVTTKIFKCEPIL